MGAVIVKRKKPKRLTRKKPDPIPDWQVVEGRDGRERLLCETCRELVVIGSVGMTCGCGTKIQTDFQGIDVEKRFPHQVSNSPADRLLGVLLRKGSDKR